ncbi:MFS transporter [Kutzneria sp. CA-103260]|uniref:MFS transporter n=1 Tax=Kutzneria sp. CA-103260 TaxID=2802641 RepID=UPI001BA8310F|nr:MFS transporter [Kutzneria sp. CA-103260]
MREKATPLTSFGRANYLLLGQLFTSTGTGAILATAAIFLIRSVRLPPTEVGIGMAAVGVISFAALFAIGPAVDRFGPRKVIIISTILAATATACFAWIDSLVTFVLFESVSNSALLGMSVGQRALIGRVMGAGDRVRYQAYSRSVSNVGYALGTLAVVPLLQADTHTAYTAIFLGTAVIIGATVPCTVKGPYPETAPARKSTRMAIADVRYVVMAILCGLLTARSKILTVAVPLWIATHTHAPLGLTGFLLFLNTAVVVVLQVRFSRGAADLAGASRVTLFGGASFVGAFILIALASTTTTGVAIAMLIAGIVLFTLGEMWTAAASWTYSYELADPALQGQYQSIFALGRTGGNIVGSLLASVVAALAITGWGVVAAVLLSCCVLTAVATPANRAVGLHSQVE